MMLEMSCLRISGVVSAIDINKGRLRILREAAKLQQVVDVITTVHADLRVFSVCYYCCKNEVYLGCVWIKDLVREK